jgi:hypothetical protein
MKRFDLVRILSIDNVKWLSGPAGRPASPHGNWSVVAGIGDKELLISKDETLVRIPKKDVALIASYDNQRVIDTISRINSAEDLDKFKKENENGSEKGQG